MFVKLSENFSIFYGHARQRGKELDAPVQIFERTASSFLNKWKLSFAKTFGANSFENAAPEIREIDSGQKTQNLCKRCWNKNSWKKSELVEAILEKIDRKPVALASMFLTK